MKQNNNIEVFFVSKASFTDSNHADLVKWLTNTLQPAIEKQEEGLKKLFLNSFKDAPAIFLS